MQELHGGLKQWVNKNLMELHDQLLNLSGTPQGLPEEEEGGEQVSHACCKWV
jgi:hypothetical protein